MKASPHIEGKFKVVGVVPGPINTGLGTFDLRTISLADAERLHKAGVSCLRKISPKAPPKKKHNTPEVV